MWGRAKPLADGVGVVATCEGLVTPTRNAHANFEWTNTVQVHLQQSEEAKASAALMSSSPRCSASRSSPNVRPAASHFWINSTVMRAPLTQGLPSITAGFEMIRS
jgi:hypothetical protein